MTRFSRSVATLVVALAVIGLYAALRGAPVSTPPAAWTAPSALTTSRASSPNSSPATTGPSTASTPVILNATPTARAGDIIGIQGWNFGTAPSVWLDSTTSATVALPIVNQVGDTFVAVQIPGSATGGLSVRVRSGSVDSVAVTINQARAYHLDALQIVPGGKVRVFGRNLQLPGSVATVRFDAVPGAIDVGASNEHLLVVTAPTGLQATAASVITVDNGNGSGPSTLDRTIEVVVVGAGGDPFALGVGWGAAFTDLATRTIDARTDRRLSSTVTCDGTTDDTAGLQNAVQLARRLGGAVVQLPPGVCFLANGVQLDSTVVIRGAGQVATFLRYAHANPIFAGGIDTAGLADLTLQNAGSTEGLLLHDSHRVFLKHVGLLLGTSHQMFLTNNRNLAIEDCDIQQPGSIGDQGPLVAGGSHGFVFTDNTIGMVTGTTAFGLTSDGYIGGNHWTRDGSYPQTDATVIHLLALDFAARVAVIGNTFDVIHGPIRPEHNDGEVILTEGGGSARTESLGTVQSATATSIVDATATLNVDPLGTGSLPENLGVAIVAGRGAGQTRRIVGYAGKTITVDTPWAVTPDRTSRYATMVWGLEKSLIKGNTLAGNPRGIWLYQTGIREVDVIGNTLTENGGIFLRAYQSLADKQFMPIYGVKIAGNTITNTSPHTSPATIGAVFTNHDGGYVGVSIIGLDVQGNALTAARPNIVDNTLFDYAGSDGYVLRMKVEARTSDAPSGPRLLGTIFQRNACTACDIAYRLGTGANGTTLGATTLIHSPRLYATDRTSPGTELATHTVVVTPPSASRSRGSVPTTPSDAGAASQAPLRGSPR